MPSQKAIRFGYKPLLFLVCLLPFADLTRRALLNGGVLLGANPLEEVIHQLGLWGLRFLVITLAVTPVRKVFGWPQLVRFRRMLGLFAFFYGCLHFTTYVWLDKFFDVSAMLKDVARRPFITAGFTAFVLLIPLALTSTAGWIRRLGGRRWQALHRLIYISAVAAAVHYYWLVKSDIRLPFFYAAVVGMLLLWRIINRRTTRPAPVGGG